MISEQLMGLLACPCCHEKITAAPEYNGLLCERCRLVFPVRDGIAVMLLNEAQKISDPDPGVPGQ